MIKDFKKGQNFQAAVCFLGGVAVAYQDDGYQCLCSDGLKEKGVLVSHVTGNAGADSSALQDTLAGCMVDVACRFLNIAQKK